MLVDVICDIFTHCQHKHRDLGYDVHGTYIPAYCLLSELIQKMQYMRTHTFASEIEFLSFKFPENF